MPAALPGAPLAGVCIPLAVPPSSTPLKLVIPYVRLSSSNRDARACLQLFQAPQQLGLHPACSATEQAAQLGEQASQHATQAHQLCQSFLERAG